MHSIYVYTDKYQGLKVFANSCILQELNTVTDKPKANQTGKQTTDNTNISLLNKCLV